MSFSINKLCSNVLPQGKYKVLVNDIKFKASATGETSHDIVVNYTIIDGPHAKKTLMLTIYEKTFSFKLKPFLTACKVDLAREFATEEELYKFILTQAKGKTIMVDLVITQYQGKEYNDIKDWSPLPDSTTSINDVLSGFGTESTVKGMSVSDLDAIQDVSAPVEDEASDEPELDLSDDNPF